MFMRSGASIRAREDGTRTHCPSVEMEFHSHHFRRAAATKQAEASVPPSSH